MSQVAIREHDGKHLLARHMNISGIASKEGQYVQVSPSTDLDQLPRIHAWLLEMQLVVKPDQLIKRRGKAGLIGINLDWGQVKEWLEQRRGQSVSVEHVTGVLDHFLVEPFLPHDANDEYYICIQSLREGDEILFYHEGGVDVGDVDTKAKRVMVPIMEEPSDDQLRDLLQHVPAHRQQSLSHYLRSLFHCYATLHFAYLEINPLVMRETVNGPEITPLDLAAKIDEAARFVAHQYWGHLSFPPPFGREATPDEAYISSLDAKTGASLKLTILNPHGRIWTMVAGGGASVIYADTVVDLGGGDELANYGEYSGAPTESLTHQYAVTILKLMTTHRRTEPKVLLIGGGIANFTNVAETFKGIIRALKEYKEQLIDHNVHIFVRRAGPNYQEGLKLMRELGRELGVPLEVFGPEAHITSIVSMALGKPVPKFVSNSVAQPESGSVGLGNTFPVSASDHAMDAIQSSPSLPCATPPSEKANALFTDDTRAIVFGMQPQAVQNMLDFDYICQRNTPSVAAIVYPFASGLHYRQFYWSSTQIMIPVYQNLEQALAKFTDVDTVVNFASSRSAYEATLEMLRQPQVKTVAIIAEGVPERHTRHIIAEAEKRGVVVIGPATVGGIKPGCFRIGNTGGMLDNIIASRLFRPGSVAYVSRSGGLSNELNNIISRVTDGVNEGIAIGGDRYPITTYMSNILRYQDNPKVKVIVLLGEVGGLLEYEVADAIKRGVVTKPVVAWCTGTCAKIFPYEVQFGHAGAIASGQLDTAAAKNAALKEAGAHVPDNFDEFPAVLAALYSKMVASGEIVPVKEVEPPKVPVDYAWARKLGLIRKPAMFMSSISDERGDELTYGGMPISQIFEEELGIGGALGLLWFRRRLPPYACRFIEMVLTVTADHGPAVSGAHNTIVTARAGKDLISSLVSGLLTIGPRFGGALDEAAAKFSWAYDNGLSPEEFVSHMSKNKELIMGIGHKVKSLENPDKRVTLVTDFVFKHFSRHDVLDYAIEVEKITTRKKSNLILNVDGAIGCAFVDLLRGSGHFSPDEAQEYVEMGSLNGLFVLGRSIGFIGHFLDQKRLKQGLYRHPTEDIAYLLGDNSM